MGSVWASIQPALWLNALFRAKLTSSKHFHFEKKIQHRRELNYEYLCVLPSHKIFQKGYNRLSFFRYIPIYNIHIHSKRARYYHTAAAQRSLSTFQLYPSFPLSLHLTNQSCRKCVCLCRLDLYVLYHIILLLEYYM